LTDFRGVLRCKQAPALTGLEQTTRLTGGHDYLQSRIMYGNFRARSLF